MKKILSLNRVIFLFFIVLFLSAACSEQKKDLSGEITLYTSLPEKNMLEIKKDFEKTHGQITLNFVRSGTQGILKRIYEENAQGSVKADVVWVADFVAGEELKTNNLLLSYNSPQAEGIIPLFIDPDSYFYGSRLLSMVLVFNKDLVPSLPTDYQDLLDSAIKGKIGIVNPLASGSSFYAVAAMSMEEELGWEYFRKLNANGARIVKNNGEMCSLIEAGELVMGIALDYMARNIMRNNPETPLDFVFPESGTVILASPIGILKDSKNVEGAKIFLDYVLSMEGQHFLSSETQTTPLRFDVKPPEGIAALRQIKILSADHLKIGKNKYVVEDTFTAIFPVEEQ